MWAHKCFLEIDQTMSESESTRKDFPDWENLYKSQSVETMLWYNDHQAIRRPNVQGFKLPNHSACLPQC